MARTPSSAKSSTKRTRPSSRLEFWKPSRMAVRPDAAIASISVAVVAIAARSLLTFTKSRQRAIESSDSTAPSQKPQVTVTAPTSAWRNSLKVSRVKWPHCRPSINMACSLLSGLPQNEVGADHPALGKPGAAFTGLEEIADGTGDRAGVERHGGHRRTSKADPGQAAEAYDRHVVGNGEAAIGGGGHAAERQLVARRDDGAKTQALGERFGHCLVARIGSIALRDVPDQHRIDLLTVRLQRLAITIVTRTTDCRGGDAADEGYRRATPRHQMGRGRRRAADVVM